MTREELKKHILEMRLIQTSTLGRFKIQQRLTASGTPFIVLWMGKDGFEIYTVAPGSVPETATLLGFLPADLRDEPEPEWDDSVSADQLKSFDDPLTPVSG